MGNEIAFSESFGDTNFLPKGGGGRGRGIVWQSGRDR